LTSYNFDDESIRFSTLHSAKGLDFPVVLLFLPNLEKIYTDDSYDDKVREKITKNILYVAMTRAIDMLNIFVTPESNIFGGYLDGGKGS